MSMLELVTYYLVDKNYVLLGHLDYVLQILQLDRIACTNVQDGS
jgi:hypothetical protein